MAVQDSITSPWSDSSEKLLSTSGYGIGSWPGKALLQQHPRSCSSGPLFSRLHVRFSHFKGSPVLSAVLARNSPGDRDLSMGLFRFPLFFLQLFGVLCP